MFRKLFNADSKKPKFEQKDGVGLLLKEPDFNQNARPIEANPMATVNLNNKETEDIEDSLEKLKKGDSPNEDSSVLSILKKKRGEEDAGNQKKIEIPRAKNVLGADNVGAAISTQKVEENKKDIAEGLNKLKSNSIAAGGTLQSKMPLSAENINNDRQEIKIPKAEEKLGEKIKQSKNEDRSIFGGKSEISRLDLKGKLRKDPNVWKAERQAGLTLSPLERVKLEKEVFSQAYGRNISKTDLKWGIKKLGQKLVDAKNAAEHEKIRKEIKFFKKIGGIK